MLKSRSARPHVVVTGASSGIGAALVREYLGAGAAVTAVARRKDKLSELCADAGDRAFIVRADLSKVAHAADWIPEAEAALGPIDVLINNAGMQLIGPVEAADPEVGEELLRLNVHTPMRLIRALLPGMLERERGAIVNIASLSALTPMPGMFYYNASKAALAGASEALWAELRGSGVHVVTVYPGPVDTALGHEGLKNFNASNPTVRVAPWGTPEELARIVRRAVDRRQQHVVYPKAYATARQFPNLARYLVYRFLPTRRRDGRRRG
jgi:short-subunit dehydrogenase